MHVLGRRKGRAASGIVFSHSPCGEGRPASATSAGGVFPPRRCQRLSRKASQPSAASGSGSLRWSAGASEARVGLGGGFSVLRRWPEALPALIEDLRGGAASGGVNAALLVLRKLVAVFEFRGRETKQQLDAVIEATWPLVLPIAAAVLQQRSPLDEEAMTQVKLALKIYWSCTQFCLTSSPLIVTSIDSWMELIEAVLKVQGASVPWGCRGSLWRPFPSLLFGQSTRRFPLWRSAGSQSSSLRLSACRFVGGPRRVRAERLDSLQGKEMGSSNCAAHIFALCGAKGTQANSQTRRGGFCLKSLWTTLHRRMGTAPDGTRLVVAETALSAADVALSAHAKLGPAVSVSGGGKRCSVLAADKTERRLFGL